MMENIIKRLQCPLCESDKISKFSKWDHRLIGQCQKCAFVFATQYDGAVLENIYLTNYYDSPTDPRIKIWINRFQKTWRGLVDDLLFAKPSIKNLLDNGAGTGGFLIHFQKDSPHTKLSAIESAEHAKAHLLASVSDLKMPVDSAEDIRGIDEKYDAVVLLQCLEHVSQPLELCKDIHRILNDDFTEIQGVPAVIWEDAVKGKIEIKCYANKTHLQFFSNQTLVAMMQKAGFKKIERISRFGGTEISGINAVFQFILRKLCLSTELRYIIKK